MADNFKARVADTGAEGTPAVVEGLNITDAYGNKPKGTSAQRQEQQSGGSAYNHLEYPAADAWAVRAAYLGVTGKLFPNMTRVRQTMLQGGPVGEAAVARMDALKSAGWKFGWQLPTDPYLRETVPNPFNRALKSLFIVSGYHDPKYGKVAFNPVTGALKSVMGMAPSTDREGARVFQHELSHGRYDAGWLAYEASPEARARFAALETPGAPTRLDLERLGLSGTVPLTKAAHGEEMVREEMRALSSESVATTRLGERGLNGFFPSRQGLSNLWIRESLQNDNLGSIIHKTWDYTGFSAITREQANTVATDYNRSFSGGIYFDGKINPAAEQQIARGISELPVTPPAEAPLTTSLSGSAEADSAMARFFANPGNRTFLNRTAQGLGALGLAFTITDVGNAFAHSKGTGVGRLADIGTSYLGYEGGMAAGSLLAESAAELVGRRIPLFGQLAVPLISLMSGIVTAQVVHATVGSKLETGIQQAIDGKPHK